MSIEKEGIIFYSISAGRDKKFNINGITSQLSSLSVLLTGLKDSPKFNDPFISQIAEVRKVDQKAFSFSLSFEYKEI